MIFYVCRVVRFVCLAQLVIELVSREYIDPRSVF